MKQLVIIPFLFFIIFSSYTQNDRESKDSLIHIAVIKKIDNYYELYRFFERGRFDSEEIDLLFKESRKNNYKLGEVYAYNLLGRSFRNDQISIQGKRLYPDVLGCHWIRWDRWILWR